MFRNCIKRGVVFVDILSPQKSFVPFAFPRFSSKMANNEAPKQKLMRLEERLVWVDLEVSIFNEVCICKIKIKLA